jgi:ankyrin repeat protein
VAGWAWGARYCCYTQNDAPVFKAFLGHSSFPQLSLFRPPMPPCSLHALWPNRFSPLLRLWGCVGVSGCPVAVGLCTPNLRWLIDLVMLAPPSPGTVSPTPDPITVVSQTGNTPLFYASRNNHVDVAAMLVERGADVNLRCHDGETPLMAACVWDAEGTARYLLAHGADVRMQDFHHRSALMLAAMSGAVGCVRLLLSHGASPSCVDEVRRQHTVSPQALSVC